MNHNKTYIIFFLLLLIGWPLQQVSAQDNTLYQMRGIPQSLDYNPAHQPDCNVYVNLPAISSIQASVNNNGFAWSDFIHPGSGNMSDSLILDFDNLASELNDRNHLRTDVKTTLLGFGFRVRKTYITFGVSTHVNGLVGIPKGLVDFRNGNYNAATGETFDLDFSGLGVDVMAYNEIAIGASREIIDGLTAGIRIKRLWGIGALHAEKTDLALLTNNETYGLTARADMQFSASFPADYTYDENGNFDNVEPASPDINNDLISNDNRGLAFDIGATYRLNSEFDFSLSIIDMGGITWRTNTSTLQAKGLYEFTGVDASPNADGEIAFNDGLEQVFDSLETVFTPEVEEGGEFRSPLQTKFYLNANYRLSEKVNVSVTNKNIIYDSSMHPQLIFGIQANPTKSITTKLTYSMMNRSFNNFGFGFGARLGGLQLYAVTDNFTGLIWPHNTRSVNIRLGINLLFGCQQKIDHSLIE